MADPALRQLDIRSLPVENRWCVHSYYTLCPYAPDGSGRILLAGADLDGRLGEVLILSADGEVLDRFGRIPATSSFWHTGFWQSWSPDARRVYYQTGTMKAPRIVRRELATGAETAVDGDMEGVPPSGEPGISCSHGLLYAAGYGDGRFKPEEAPVPFLEREQHGMSEVFFDPPASKFVLTTQEILDRHPDRRRLLEAERDLQGRLGKGEGLTLMTYCVRWNRQGTRFLFYFGNHCVAKERGEPRLAYVFTADREFRDIRLALDLSFGRRGVHWGWQPDGDTMIGYGPHPEDPSKPCLAEARYDGSGYRMLSEHRSGGHPSASPADPDLLVTDEGGPDGHGSVVFISRKTGEVAEKISLPKYAGEKEASGRNPMRVCHHPVFNSSGDRLLVNTLSGKRAKLAEIRLS